MTWDDEMRLVAEEMRAGQYINEAADTDRHRMVMAPTCPQCGSHDLLRYLESDDGERDYWACVCRGCSYSAAEWLFYAAAAQ